MVRGLVFVVLVALAVSCVGVFGGAVGYRYAVGVVWSVFLGEEDVYSSRAVCVYAVGGVVYAVGVDTRSRGFTNSYAFRVEARNASSGELLDVWEHRIGQMDYGVSDCAIHGGRLFFVGYDSVYPRRHSGDTRGVIAVLDLNLSLVGYEVIDSDEGEEVVSIDVHGGSVYIAVEVAQYKAFGPHYYYYVEKRSYENISTVEGRYNTSLPVVKLRVNPVSRHLWVVGYGDIEILDMDLRPVKSVSLGGYVFAIDFDEDGYAYAASGGYDDFGVLRVRRVVKLDEGGDVVKSAELPINILQILYADGLLYVVGERGGWFDRESVLYVLDRELNTVAYGGIYVRARGSYRPLQIPLGQGRIGWYNRTVFIGGWFSDLGYLRWSLVAVRLEKVEVQQTQTPPTQTTSTQPTATGTTTPTATAPTATTTPPVQQALQTPPVATTAEAPANISLQIRPGDWITYRVYTLDKPSCVFRMRIEVLNVSGSWVEYRRTLRELVSGDRWECSAAETSIRMFITEGVKRYDVSKAEPDPYNVFVSPTYTGRYGNTVYERGVLKEFKGTLRTSGDIIFFESRLAIEMEDTSIPWLKGERQTPWVLYALAVVPPIAIAIAVPLLLVKKKRKKQQKAETQQN